MAELIGGAVIGALYAEVQRLVLHGINLNTRFRSELNRLKTTLDCLLPLVKEAQRLEEEEEEAPSRETDEYVRSRREQILAFQVKLQETEKMIVECCKLHRWNLRKRSRYCKRLAEMDSELVKFVQIGWNAFIEIRRTERQLAELNVEIRRTERRITELKELLGRSVAAVESDSDDDQETETPAEEIGPIVQGGSVHEQQSESSCTTEMQRLWEETARYVEEWSLTELKEATKDFSFIDGMGGSANIHRAQLRGTMVAIKRFNTYPLTDRDFAREVEVLSRVSHPNIVKLLGIFNGEEISKEGRSLVLEWIPNGSLLDHLSLKEPHNTAPLPWPARARIAAEVCSALLCLQSMKPWSVFHGDVKPENILLDGDLNAKLCDFGTAHIARHVERREEDATYLKKEDPLSVRGTRGYMDPYYWKNRMYTSKSDVYGLGVVLLELFTGFVNPGAQFTGYPFGSAYDQKSIPSLVEFARRRQSAGDGASLMDRKAIGWPLKEAMVLLDLGLRCCENDPKDRPDVGTVLKELQTRCHLN